MHRRNSPVSTGTSIQSPPLLGDRYCMGLYRLARLFMRYLDSSSETVVPCCEPPYHRSTALALGILMKRDEIRYQFPMEIALRSHVQYILGDLIHRTRNFFVIVVRRLPAVVDITPYHRRVIQHEFYPARQARILQIPHSQP